MKTLLGRQLKDKGIIHSTSNNKNLALGMTVGLTKKVNEDVVGFNRLSNKMLLVAIADGHWGYEGAETAIKTILEVIGLDFISNKKNILKLTLQIESVLTVRFGFKGMDEKKDFTPETSFLFAIVKDDIATIVNYGDSLAYIFRDNKLKKLFRTQKTWIGAFSHYQLRQRIDSVKATKITRINLHNNDILLLFTDGITECIYEKEVVKKQDLKRIIVETKKVKEICKKLLENSMKCGGEDNASCIVFQHTKS